MKKFLVSLVVFFLISMNGIICAQDNPEVLPPSSQSSINFRLALRELWQYQVTWTRSYIVSTLANLEDVAVVKDKLVKNQEKIGGLITPYYGGFAGNDLANLLREHIVIAVEMIRAVKAKDDRALQAAMEKGRSNADQLANLLSRAKNPFWDKNHLKEMFYKHLEYINMQVNYRIQKEWGLEIDAYDDGLAHVLQLADILADGIVHQFPDKFKE